MKKSERERVFVPVSAAYRNLSQNREGKGRWERHYAFEVMIKGGD